jgi:hypothetical protein
LLYSVTPYTLSPQITMKLFLASEVKHPDSLKKLEEYVGGFTNKKIAYIPTAANGESFG